MYVLELIQFLFSTPLAAGLKLIDGCDCVYTYTSKVHMLSVFISCRHADIMQGVCMRFNHGHDVHHDHAYAALDQ